MYCGTALKIAADKAADAVDYSNSGQIEWSEFVAAMLPASQELFATALLVAFYISIPITMGTWTNLKS